MTTNAWEQEDRQAWMGLLARAKPDDLAALMPAHLPDHAVLRAPEIGAVMLRGRIGVTGAPFNLGEMTVTRCSLRLVCGAVGHAHVQGRNRDHARQAALVDALMQTPRAAEIEATILRPLSRSETERAALRSAKAAATRVEFFTLARGEDN